MRIEHARGSAQHTRYQLSDGTHVPGVTTIVDVINKPALVGWANALGLAGHRVSPYVSAQAMVGRLTHYLIQCDLADKPPDMADYTPNEVSAARRAFASYLAWKARQSDLAVVFSERSLVSEKHGYGGTVDLYARRGGRSVLLDFKTSSAIYDEHLYQVAGGYSQLLIDNGYGVDECGILMIGRNDDDDYTERIIHNPEPYRAVFNAAHDLYRAIRSARGQSRNP